MIQHQKCDSRKSRPRHSRSAVHPLSRRRARDKSSSPKFGGTRSPGRLVSHYSGADGAAPSSLTALRHSATSRLHGSWQSSGITGSPSPVWSCDVSNFSGGSWVDAGAPVASRFHKIVRKHPSLERQKSPTTWLTCSSEIFAATRYMPDCRFKVSRSVVVTSRFAFHALNSANLPGQHSLTARLNSLQLPS